MESIVKVVGIGPGDGRYITPLAWEAVSNAEVLIGGRTQLQKWASPEQEQYVIGNNLTLVVQFIRKQAGKKIVVLTSGDSGLFSIGHYLVQEMGRDKLEFIPGISSVQLMFARLKRPWQDVRILSLHGRSLEILDMLLAGNGVAALLTGGDNSPQRLACYLLDKGMVNAPVALGKNLSYDDELIVETSLLDLCNDPVDYSNSVMVVFNGA